MLEWISHGDSKYSCDTFWFEISGDIWSLSVSVVSVQPVMHEIDTMLLLGHQQHVFDFFNKNWYFKGFFSSWITEAILEFPGMFGLLYSFVCIFYSDSFQNMMKFKKKLLINIWGWIFDLLSALCIHLSLLTQSSALSCFHKESMGWSFTMVLSPIHSVVFPWKIYDARRDCYLIDFNSIWSFNWMFDHDDEKPPWINIFAMMY